MQQSGPQSFRSSGMPRQKKVGKVGRPALPKGHAKAKIVPVRFDAGDLKVITEAAKTKKQTVSEWIRSTIHAAI
jgi:hypothetical protein